MVDAHVHLDKTFTLSRMGKVVPGLMGAIDAMMRDREGWTPKDVRSRATKALQWAHSAGTVLLRTHCDWWDPTYEPVAWSVLNELAQEWRGRLTLERVNLSPLTLYADRGLAFDIARRIAAVGPHAHLGAFVHSSNWDPQALKHLFEAAQAHELDVDLHCDEELYPGAQGLGTTAGLLEKMGFRRRVVCGHTCALTAKSRDEALHILDAVARTPITLICLPATNLLLQDATEGHTPRWRGVTMVHEERARGIPLLLASDNVQDPFCASGSYDPIEALQLGAAAAHLRQPFDHWTDSICRSDWLSVTPSTRPLQAGALADFIIFTQADAWGFPSRTQPRGVLRAGVPQPPTAPPSWFTTAPDKELSACPPAPSSVAHWRTMPHFGGPEILFFCRA
jgi:cytosine deaminase